MYQPEELKNRYKGISNSSLTWFRLSPKYFRDKIDRKIEEPELNYLELGTKLHYYLLEPQKFNELYIYLSQTTPTNAKQKEFCIEFSKHISDKEPERETAKKIYKTLYATDKKSDAKIETEAMVLVNKYREYINYLKDVDSYKDVINFTTNKFLTEARQAVTEHKKARELMLTTGYSTSQDIVTQDYIEVNEARIYWEHPEIKINGEPIVCKSKIDRLVIDHMNKVIKIIDLKTSYNIKMFPSKFEEYKYNEQLTFYWMAVGYMFSKLYPDKKLSEYTKETYIVAISTNPSDSMYLVPVECKVFKIEDKWLETGLENINSTLQEMVWYLENDLWDHSREYYEGDGTEII